MLLGLVTWWLMPTEAPRYHEARKGDVSGGKITPIVINPIGQVKRQGDQVLLEISPALAPALDGLAGFSHVWVFYWFHENDRPEERATLKVHPRRDPANPLTGVFATRAPVRPNLIGLAACRLIGVKGNMVEVEGLDARDGSPVLDLKPYLPGGDSIPEARTPGWVSRSKPPTH
jgi:tRNA-Thr(GGU) m(6)t(6)A37 methyltransferase TsaA